jgi:hypothetical protein
MNHRPSTTAEKRLLTLTGCGIILLMAVGQWQTYMNTNPVVDIPAPVMPSPNAYDHYMKAVQIYTVQRNVTPGYLAIDPTSDSALRQGYRRSNWRSVIP